MSRAQQAMEELWSRNRAFWERHHKTMLSVQRECAESNWGAASPDRSVAVTMRGDYRIQKLEIHPEAYETATADSLADAVIDAYNASLRAVHQGQKDLTWQRLNANPEETS